MNDENYQWIFSGIGVSAITAILTIVAFIYRRVKSTRVSEKEALIPIKLEPEIYLASSPGSEVKKIITRLNEVLFLMNERRVNQKFTITGLAELLNLNSTGELESILDGNREPDFKFIDSFCSSFGVNKKWLTDGTNHPFESSEISHIFPLDYLEEIKKSKPECVYFLRCKSPIGETMIVLKYTNWHFKTLRHVWHVSDEVGGTGIQQLVSLYKLIIELKQNRQNCGGRFVDKSDFWRLNSGDAFPGALTDAILLENPWWDYFTDIDHKFPISKNYESWYGSGFTNAQKIVKTELDR